MADNPSQIALADHPREILRPHSTSPDGERVVAVVVTHNRRDELVRLIQSLLEQTVPPSIIVVDNACTDGTLSELASRFPEPKTAIHLLRSEENLGGAGGFNLGMAYGLTQTWEWFWLMDDDAVAEPEALQSLMSAADDPGRAYGSAALALQSAPDRLCWPVIEIKASGRRRFVEDPLDLSPLARVESLPFLGFFLHRGLIERCGLPDGSLFVYGDDVEYCWRLASRGVSIHLVKRSIIRHPKPDSITIRVGGLSLQHRRLPPWKRYYEVRNKILIARRHAGHKLWTQTLPGILLRMAISLWAEPLRRRQLRAYGYGLLDGVLGRHPRRYLPGMV